MEAADTDRKARIEERTGKIDRAWELVRLHTDHSYQRTATLLPYHADDAVGPYPPVGLVVSVQADLNVRSQYLAPARVLGKSIEAGQRIGRNGGTNPLDGIAVVVVVRRLDHHKMQ